MWINYNTPNMYTCTYMCVCIHAKCIFFAYNVLYSPLNRKKQQKQWLKLKENIWYVCTYVCMGYMICMYVHTYYFCTVYNVDPVMYISTLYVEHITSVSPNVQMYLHMYVHIIICITSIRMCTFGPSCMLTISSTCICTYVPTHIHM